MRNEGADARDAAQQDRPPTQAPAAHEDSPFHKVRVLLQLEETVPIHELPAATLYALLARAHCQATGKDSALPDGVVLTVPERGRLEIAAREMFAFGFNITTTDRAQAVETASDLVAGLRQLANRQYRSPKDALAGNYLVLEVTDLIAGKPWQEQQPLHPIPAKHISAEYQAARPFKRLTLRFTAPLRARRSGKGSAPGHFYMDGSVFEPGVFAQRVVQRARDLGIEDPVSLGKPRPVKDLEALDNHLVWIDMAYGPVKSRKFLGGAVGTVVIDGLTPHVARILVWGQYTRAGENTRFGFGAYRIVELGADPFECRRAVGLVELALREDVIDRLATEHELESGVLNSAARAIRAGTYRPRPVFRCTLTAKGGVERELAIPAPVDRALQRAVLERIAPAFELFFEQSSLAYRRGLGRHRAADRIRSLFEDGFRYALRADFQRFFESIDHQLLEARVDAYLGDHGLVELIMTWVRQAVEAGGPGGRGLPIGSPLSPLLSNLFLDSFDEEIARAGGRLVRYADDFLVLYRTRGEAEAAYELATQQAEALLLELNRDKTVVLDLREPFEFLGFRFEKHEPWGYEPTGVPARLEHLGWRESRRAAGFAPGSIGLPGEVGPEAAGGDAALVFGPMPGWLEVKEGQLVGRYENGSTTSPTPIERLGEVVLIGPVSLSAGAMRLLLDHQVPVLIADEHGQLAGMLADAGSAVEGETLLAHVDRSRDPAFCLEFARQVVRAKLWNYGMLAMATRRGPDDHLPDQLFKRAAEAFRSQSLEELLGHEGAGAAAWYDGFGHRLPSGFSFPGRRAPDAEDPINVLLNIAQTFLHRQCLLALHVARLAPMLGLFHMPRPGHPALASDLQEQFRHLMDRAVLEAVTSLSQRHFTRAEYGPFALRIEPWAYRQFMATLLRVMALPCAGLNQSESKSYFRHVQSTTRALKRSLLDPSIPWLPFRHPQRDPLQAPSPPDAPSLNVQSAISNPESLPPSSATEAAPHEEEGGRGEPPATGGKP